MAQEVNTYKSEDVSMGTPPMRLRRAIISHAATAKPGQKQSRKLVARYDVSVAFFHADNSEKIAVIDGRGEGSHLSQRALGGTSSGDHAGGGTAAMGGL